nr:aldose 1-epimerase family protein [uncultured Holophaga sp.]
MDACTLQNLFLRLSLKARGAEMVRLQTLSGVDVLWDGDPKVWPRHAPTLFPIVGSLKDDTHLHNGERYYMSRHGFARDMDWRLVKLSRERATFVLKDNPASLAQYPFPFELRVTYRLLDQAVRVIYEVINPGSAPLPASLGAHPALRWPLLPGLPKDRHTIRFELPEAEPVLRLRSGLLDPSPRPTPVKDRILQLADELFREDALIFTRLRSHKLRYEAPGSPVVEVAWDGFPQLGLWSKPGADFLCIEPWHGVSSPIGFVGELSQKPGSFLIPPGETRRFAYQIAIWADA